VSRQRAVRMLNPIAKKLDRSIHSHMLSFQNMDALAVSAGQRGN